MKESVFNSRMFTLFLALFTTGSVYADNPNRLDRIWVFALTDLSKHQTFLPRVELGTQDVIDLMTRAKAAEYNGIVLYDYRFGALDRPAPGFRRNVRLVRHKAEELGLNIIPVVIPLGAAILQNDPNLAEGVPVHEAGFKVQLDKSDPPQRVAVVAHTAEKVRGGGLNSNNELAMWTPLPDTEPANAEIVSDITHSGAGALRITHTKESINWGMKQNVTLKPRHQYRFQLDVRFEDSLLDQGSFKLQVVANPFGEDNAKPLTVVSYVPPVDDFKKPRSKDWHRHEVVFNTFEFDDVSVSVAITGGKPGKVWLDDISITQVGGFNLVRRKGCPVKVTSQDGRTEYEERLDYLRWRDPKVGINGFYNASTYLEQGDEQPAPPIVLTRNSRIEKDAELRVSYYHALPTTANGTHISCCLRHEKLFRLYKKQVRQISRLLQPKIWFMDHDEIRVAGQCRLCNTRESVGEILAENVKRCATIIRDLHPQAEIRVWNDMFDPYHNAHPPSHKESYFPLVRDSWENSWRGLPDYVRIVNWSGSDESLKFFENELQDFQLVAGFYDEKDWEAKTMQFRNTTEPMSGIDGVMYSTYERQYDHLERFLELVTGPALDGPSGIRAAANQRRQQSLPSPAR